MGVNGVTRWNRPGAYPHGRRAVIRKSLLSLPYLPPSEGDSGGYMGVGTLPLDGDKGLPISAALKHLSPASSAGEGRGEGVTIAGVPPPDDFQ